MKEIVIKIGHDGKVQVSVSGVKGTGCKDLTKQLEDALGVSSDSQPTQEFYETRSEEDYNIDF